MTGEEMLGTIKLLKAQRDALVETYNDRIETMMLNLEGLLMKEGKDSLKTEDGTAYWQKNTQVEVEDWNMVMEFVAKNNAFDILQRRISPAQLEARIKAGAVIKGVTIKKSKSFMVRGAKE